MTPRRRVVITGMGVVSPLGCDLGMFWHLLSAGESGITPITHFDTSPFQSSLAGEVNDFDPRTLSIPKNLVVWAVSPSSPSLQPLWPAGMHCLIWIKRIEVA